MDWYTRSRVKTQELFPEDWETFLALLAVTSVNATVRVNVTLALKAHRQLKAGEEFHGFLGIVIDNLNRVKQGETLKGVKINAFLKALLGDKQSVVVDRWMARAYGWSKVTPANQPVIEKLIRYDALFAGVDPSDFQAKLWADTRGRGEDFADILQCKLAQRRLF